MSQQDKQPLSVKAFIETVEENRIKIDVQVTPVGGLEQAQEIFNTYRRDDTCQAAYIFRGDRIIGSWDRHANYLTAINDIDDIDEYAYHTHLTDAEREQLRPWEQFLVEEE